MRGGAGRPPALGPPGGRGGGGGGGLPRQGHARGLPRVCNFPCQRAAAARAGTQVPEAAKGGDARHKSHSASSERAAGVPRPATVAAAGGILNAGKLVDARMQRRTGRRR